MIAEPCRFSINLFRHYQPHVPVSASCWLRLRV